MQPFTAALAGPPIESDQFWKQPYKVAASKDPDTATGQTITIMCQHVRNAAQDRMVQETAQSAVNQFAELSRDMQDALRIATAAFWWCKVNLKFVHHEFIIRQRLGEVGHLQGLISPEVLVRMARPEGDCAIFSECVAAFLRVFGVPFEFVTVAANPNEPDIFSHVYLYAVLEDGTRFPIDASHGAYPGWQVPSAHVSRRQVWDMDGNPVRDQGSRFDGLHNYGMKGLGDVCDPTDPVFDANICNNLFVDKTAITVPAQTSPDWTSVVNTLLSKGFTLAEINAIQPGTQVSASGAILRQNPGYAVGSPTTAANLGISTTTLMLGGAGLLVLVLLMGKGR